MLNLDAHILIFAPSSDPADEIIAATSVVHNIPLLTRDHIMRTSKIVPLAL